MSRSNQLPVVRGALVLVLTGAIAVAVSAIADSRPATLATHPEAAAPTEHAGEVSTRATAQKVKPTQSPLPLAGTVDTRIQIPGGGYTVAAGLGSLWVGGREDGVIVRVDPDTGTVTGSAELPAPVVYVAVGEGGVWVPDFDGNQVRRVDPATLDIVATIEVGPAPEGIAIGFGSIWVANHHGASVSRIDPDSNEVIATIPVGGRGIVVGGPNAIAIGDDAVWVGLPKEHQVARIDPTTERVTTSTVRMQPCGQLTVSVGSVWAGNALCQDPNLGLARIVVATGKVTTIDAFPDPILGVAPAPDGVWYLAFNELGRVDAATNKIVARMPYDGYVSPLAWEFGSLWFVDDLNKVLVRVAPAG